MKSKLLIVICSPILFIGCNSIPQIPQPHVPKNRTNFITPNDSNMSNPLNTKPIQKTIPKAPKKHFTPKNVEDQNFSPDYMYPKTTKDKKDLSKNIIAKEDNIKIQTETMTQQECINLIGQERFDRYVQMLGSIDGAIKRCMMIKASQG
jgi:hypothetical protein